MSSRRADIERFRSPGDLIVDLVPVGTPLDGRPHTALKQRSLLYYTAGSYSASSSHQCLVCQWRFRSRARLAGAHLIAIHAREARPTSAAVGAICDRCWGSESVSMPEVEIAAQTLLRRICPGGCWCPGEETAS
jgi:hypothetical protein